MQIFLDTANPSEVAKANEAFPLDGITTNPSLVASAGRELIPTIKEIASIVQGPVSAEVISTDYPSMLKEAETLSAIAPNICVKLPITPDGLRVCRKLSSLNIMTNLTLCFSPLQAILAAKAGATFVSPFIGRVDDATYSGTDLIDSIITIFENYSFKTTVLAASIRHLRHVTEVAEIGVGAITIPPSIFYAMVKHPLTDIGLERFAKDSKGLKI